MIKLKPRLRMAADMVRIGSRLADIGTDHAYLPAALILDGTVPFAIAADLRKGPLKNAQETISANCIEDKIQLRLSDGLSLILPNEVEDIVIAGMGGILIKEILAKADWIKDSKIRLILQPQSHSEILREYLFENGFAINKESACFEDGKVYICFSAEYTGKTVSHSKSEIFLGGYKDKCDDASVAFVKKKMKRIITRYNALSEQNNFNEETELLKEIINEVKLCQQ